MVQLAASPAHPYSGMAGRRQADRGMAGSVAEDGRQGMTTELEPFSSGTVAAGLRFRHFKCDNSRSTIPPVSHLATL